MPRHVFRVPMNKDKATTPPAHPAPVPAAQAQAQQQQPQVNGSVQTGEQQQAGSSGNTAAAAAAVGPHQHHHHHHHHHSNHHKHHGHHKADISVEGAIVDTTALRSELITAIEQNKVDKARRILSTGVDANAVCDEKGRWPIHVASFMGYPALVELLLDYGAQKDQPDTALERTALLYASATSPDIVQILLNHQADIHARNKFGAGCLHYAAGAGQYECCRLLAAAGADVNARDRQKMAPLHMAARVDDIHSIDVLLEYGADIHSTDAFGKTALHHSAETCEGMASDYGKMGATFRRLVAAGIMVNSIDHNGKTALYYAIQNGSLQAVNILYELGAELMDGSSLLAMAKKFPSVIRPFLDKCVSSNIETCDPESKQFYIQFDYTCLVFFPKDIPKEKLLTMQNRTETESILQEMGVLHGLTKCTDSSILSHPVCESLLRLKWKKVKWYLYLDMLLYAVFLAFMTAVIFMEYEADDPVILDENDNTTLSSSDHGSPIVVNEGVSSSPPVVTHSDRVVYCMDTTRNAAVWTILWVLTTLLGIREMVQLIQAPLQYVVQIENMLELVLVSSVALLSLAECGVQHFVNGRDHFAAVCLIVGWTIQVTLYGKIPIFGVYIRMFAAVAVNILKCIFTYLGLLFAFSLTLHFLFRSQKDFESVGFTFLKTFSMMIGEMELVRTFIDKPTNHGGEAHIVPVTSHFIFLLFMIFVSVVLMSLLLALAVNDISSMQREGAYMQLVQQVKVSSQLEDALQKRSLLYPQYGMSNIRSLHQRKGVIFPNLKDHGKLSKDALEIVITQFTKKLDTARNRLSQPASFKDHSTDATRTTNEAVDDIVSTIKSKMDTYIGDVEKKQFDLMSEIRNQDRGSNQISREMLLIKSQMADMSTCLRELSVTMKAIAERSVTDSSPSRRSSSSLEETTVQNARQKGEEDGANTNTTISSSSTGKEEGSSVSSSSTPAPTAQVNEDKDKDKKKA